MLLVISFAAALLGSAIATWTGFGAATILTAVLAAFIEVRQTILVVAIFHAINNVMKTARFFRAINWNIALLFGSTAIVFSIAGGLLSTVAPVEFLKIVLGLFVITDASAGFLKKSGAMKPPERSKALVGGALSGFAAGIIGTGGAMRAIFLQRFVREKEAYIATSAVIALCIDISRIPVYVTQYPAGVTQGILPLLAATVLAGLTGILIAQHFLKYVSTDRFTKLILAALVIAGISLVVQGLSGVVREAG